jgi:hypothetical protein
MINVPDSLWSQMLDCFDREAENVEQVCYLDGFRCGDQAIVTTITLPNAELHSTHFHVSPECMSQAGKHFRALGMVRIAQVHTHPDSWVGHSAWDDAHAYSQMPGAVSIVLPHFARRRPNLSDAGLHLRTSADWTEIPSHEAGQFIRIVPALFDFRQKGSVTHAGKDI